MALNLYELIPKLERLKLLCSEHGITLDPECGHQVFYQGQVFHVLSAHGNHLALLDTLPAIPLDLNQIVYVEDWIQESSCLFIPRVEDVLQIIHDKTTLFPSMTPGIKATREVWQIRHPNGTTIVSGALLEGLIDLALAMIQNDSSD
ncbi:MAG: hypothetical protein ACOX5R_13630 [bacterium]